MPCIVNTLLNNELGVVGVISGAFPYAESKLMWSRSQVQILPAKPWGTRLVLTNNYQQP